MAQINRRRFLSGAGAVGMAGSLGLLSGLSAQRSWAANTSGYKAIVMIYLYGGMDQDDTIIPYDSSSYNALRGRREGIFASYDYTNPNSTRNRANLLRLAPRNASVLGGREFALPLELASLHQMFNDGDMAIVGNVGPLLNPTTREEIANGTANLPPRLFSHNDQQSTWQSLATEGARYGWGGRFMDAVRANTPGLNPVFGNISTGSNDVFLAGQDTRAFRIDNDGAPSPHWMEREWYLGYTDEDDEARRLIRSYLSRNNFGHTNIYARDLNEAGARAIDNAERVRKAFENARPIQAEFGDDYISQQLRAVAQMINVQSALETPRQIFYVTGGGYDTHSNQAGSIGANHTILANAVSSFRTAMRDIQKWQDVTVMTASEFGRGVIGNGDGTDHGWGGHHFVMGGSVDGGKVFGDLPGAEYGTASFTPDNRDLLPQVSIDQYAATVGKWFGLTPSELRSALPNLSEFDQQDLGFMGSTTA